MEEKDRLNLERNTVTPLCNLEYLIASLPNKRDSWNLGKNDDDEITKPRGR